MTTMNATVKDGMTSKVVVVSRGATVKDMAAAHRRYPDDYPIVAGPVP